MRRRPSARLLVLSPVNRVLLFRFTHSEGPLAGQVYWATPGGGVEAGETFAQAAVREFEEEVGIAFDSIGPSVARHEFVLQLPDGESVIADEQFFIVRVSQEKVLRKGWTAHEVKVMTDYRWWSKDDLSGTAEIVFPENLLSMLPC